MLRTPRPLTCALLLSAIAVSAAGCGSGGSGGKAAVLKPGSPIGMKSLRFHPDHVQVKVGQAITWHNDEGVPHDVVADSGASFRSKAFGQDGTFSWTPARAGTVKYECTLHPGMTGTLEVVAR